MALRGAYCPTHKAMSEKKRTGKEIFKGTKRDKSQPYNALYHSARWKALRKDFLAGHPYCFRCGERAVIVDHIRPHHGDLDMFFDETNLQPMCWSCHSAKTLAENGYFRNTGRGG